MSSDPTASKEKLIADALADFLDQRAAGSLINIDDFWMPKNEDKDPTLHGPDRDPSGKINPNPRFPETRVGEKRPR